MKTINAPIAQRIRASVFGTEGRRFEPCWVYHENRKTLMSLF